MMTLKTKSGYKIIQVLNRRSNVFLLTKGDRNILIDSSIKSEWRKLDKRLKELEISHIDCLILTHTHFDHAGNAFNIKSKFNPKVIVQKSGAEYLTSGDNIIPGGTNVITRTLLFLFAGKVFPKLRFEPCEYDLLVDSFFDLKEFGFNAYIIKTPGHTVDSMSVVVDDEIALVGDAMFGVFKWSVLPPYANDVEEIIKSWGLLLETNCSLFVPSHGTANSRKLVQKNYDKLNDKKFK